MKYTIFASKRFIKEFNKLPANLQRKIKNEIKILEDKPFAGISLQGTLSGKLKLRIGNYRIIYIVNTKEKRVYLLAIGHRKKVYNHF